MMNLLPGISSAVISSEMPMLELAAEMRECHGGIESFATASCGPAVPGYPYAAAEGY